MIITRGGGNSLFTEISRISATSKNNKSTSVESMVSAVWFSTIGYGSFAPERSARASAAKPNSAAKISRAAITNMNFWTAETPEEIVSILQYEREKCNRKKD